MGGICGFLGLGDKSLLKKMSQGISHLGFHEEFFVDKNVGICSKSIIEEQGLGKNEDNSVWVAFDGETFNDESLRGNLEEKGHNFSSFRPAELIAHLYEEHGHLAVKELRGSFSLALWDANEKTLILARDREGEKPVFYTYSNGGIYFASGIKALLRCNLIERMLNPIGLDYYFSWGHVPAPETLFVGIKKLPPSYLLIFKYGENKAILQKYWDLDFSEIEYDVSEDEWCRRIYDILVECISIRLKKGPLGILLGGLDSSAVAALVRRLTNEPLRSVTIMFENEEFNESYSRHVAEWLGIEAYEKTLYAKDFIRIIPELVQIFDDLRIDLLITIPSFLALETVKEKAKTVFTADGADCAFWSWGWSSSKPRKPKILSTISTSLLKRRHPLNIHEVWNVASKAWSTLRESINSRILTAHLPFELRILYGDQYFHEDELQKLLGRRSIVDVYSPFLKCLERPADDLGSKANRMRLVNKEFEVIGGWCVERLGSICAHFHLGLRTPFEDYKLKELAARIPPSLKQPSNTLDKYIFRKTLLKYSILPKEVVKQRKWGFGWGLGEIAARWFKGELKDFIEQTVDESATLVKPVLKQNVLKKYVRKGRPVQVLSLVTFILWYKSFFGQD
jgi:asparagine synthase (glutamine-hydrolysing)